MSRQNDSQGDLRLEPVTLAGKSIVRAKGYSLLELERAGLTQQDANRLGLPLDADRKTMVGSTVMQLRGLMSG